MYNNKCLPSLLLMCLHMFHIFTVGLSSQSNITETTSVKAELTTSTPKITQNRTDETPILPGNNTVNATVAEGNSTSSGNSTKLSTFGKPAFNIDAMKRASYVILAITGVAVLYIVIRAIRLRGNAKARRYKVLSRKGDTELDPLGQDNEEDDMTIYEADRPFIRT